MLFDYDKNRIGFAEKKVSSDDDNPIDVISYIHVTTYAMVFGKRWFIKAFLWSFYTGL